MDIKNIKSIEESRDYLNEIVQSDLSQFELNKELSLIKMISDGEFNFINNYEKVRKLLFNEGVNFETDVHIMSSIVIVIKSLFNSNVSQIVTNDKGVFLVLNNNSRISLLDNFKYMDENSKKNVSETIGRIFGEYIIPQTIYSGFITKNFLFFDYLKSAEFLEFIMDSNVFSTSAFLDISLDKIIVPGTKFYSQSEFLSLGSINDIIDKSKNLEDRFLDSKDFRTYIVDNIEFFESKIDSDSLELLKDDFVFESNSNNDVLDYAYSLYVAIYENKFEEECPEITQEVINNIFGELDMTSDDIYSNEIKSFLNRPFKDILVAILSELGASSSGLSQNSNNEVSQTGGAFENELATKNSSPFFSDEEIERFKNRSLNALDLQEVIGDSLKASAKSIVLNYKNYQKLLNAGVSPINGVVFYGPPGTGKTVLGESIAKSLNAPLVDLDLSKCKGKYFGESEAKLKSFIDSVLELRNRMDLEGEVDTPIVLFMDEGDSFVDRSKTESEVLPDLINMMLTYMDTMKNLNILSILCTNHIDKVDSAMIRPGRFDLEVKFGGINAEETLEMLKLRFPELFKYKTKLEILRIFLTGRTKAKIDSSINYIKSYMIIHEKSLKDLSSKKLLELAEDVTLGAKSSVIMSKKTREITAFHELGHAFYQVQDSGFGLISLVPRNTKDVDYIGYSIPLPRNELESLLSSSLKMEIKCLIAGQVAEEVFIGEVSTGASNDYKEARDMIMNSIHILEPDLFISGKTENKLTDYAQSMFLDIRKEVKKDIEDASEIFNKYCKILLKKDYLIERDRNKFIKDVEEHLNK